MTQERITACEAAECEQQRLVRLLELHSEADRLIDEAFGFMTRQQLVLLSEPKPIGGALYGGALGGGMVG
jgi:hypothetical protein